MPEIAMLPDPKRYWHHVDHFDMDDAEKIELINMVYRAMQSGVDRAFGDDPVQVVMAKNGSKIASSKYPVIDLSEANYCEANLSQTFNDKKGAKNE